MITFLRMTRLYIPKVNLMTLLLKFVIPTFISVRVHKNILSHSVKSCPPLGLTSSPQRGVFDKDVERGRQRGVFDAAPLIGQWAFDTVWPIPGISLFGMGGSYRGSFLLLLLSQYSILSGNPNQMSISLGWDNHHPPSYLSSLSQNSCFPNADIGSQWSELLRLHP